MFIYLLKVHIAAIAGHVHAQMVQCLSTFMDLCYIFRRNAITTTDLENAKCLLQKFHELRQIFVTEGVRSSISLPRQHALCHYPLSIQLFASPNGLCSSITESKHIKAVKEPWRRSNRFQALFQMLVTIIRLDKLAALRRRFQHDSMLRGSTAAYFESKQHDDSWDDDESNVSTHISDNDEVDGMNNGDKENLKDMDNAGPADGPQSLSSISLASCAGKLSISESGVAQIFDYFLYLFIRAKISKTAQPPG